MSETAPGRNKRALLIGVNEYPNLPDCSQLRGCVNDARVMERVLTTTFKFPPENIKVLLNEAATEKSIREAMERLIEDCVEGDVVVFHYSGHGSQLAALGDKPRGYDESIMPYDSGRMNNPAFPRQIEPRDIRDTEIQDWLSRLTQKTPHVTLIFDSCHSGSITRFGSDSEEAGTKLRWIPPDPLPERKVSPADLVEGRGLDREVSSSGWLPQSDRYTLLAACAAEQGAFECDHAGERYGAFTLFLTREIEQEINQAAHEITYRDIWERVSVKVNEQFQRQTPQLEGARDRLIFDVQDFAAMRYLLLTERSGEKVRLDGGAVHGLTTGSRWDIYSAGTKQTGGANDGRLGAVEVTSVGPVTAEAKVVAENHPQAIAPGARAVEAAYADSESRMAVRLTAAPGGYEQAVAELRQTLEQSELLKISQAAEGERAEVRIVYDTAAGGDGSTRSNVPAGAKWEVTDGSAPLMPRYEVAAPDSQLTIKENLETLWRFQKTLGLRHEKSTLKGKVDFILLKRGTGGKWEEVPEGEEAVYKAGDSIAFRVVNRSETLIHVSVLDLGLSKRIDVLYPPSGASEPIAVNRSGESDGAQNGGTLSVGERAGDEIELFFPDNPTFLTTKNEGDSPWGREHFKLVITTQRHDLSFLRQPGLRGEPEHPLERLIYLAATRVPQREARTKLDPQHEWFTCERAFRLQRDG
jgi:hypothetical protein